MMAQNKPHTSANADELKIPQDEWDSCIDDIGQELKDSFQYYKQSFSNLIKEATEFAKSTNPDLPGGVTRPLPLKIAKLREDFLFFSKDLESGLVRALECYQQKLSGHRYLPLNINPQHDEMGPSPDVNTLSYSQYVKTAKSQISYLKDIHDILLEASQKNTESNSAKK